MIQQFFSVIPTSLELSIFLLLILCNYNLLLIVPYLVSGTLHMLMLQKIKLPWEGSTQCAYSNHPCRSRG